MASNIRVLSALDKAPIQRYHFQVLVIVGLGFATSSYDLFCISNVSKLLGRLYYDPTAEMPGKLPTKIYSMVEGAVLAGTLTGQLVFGWLADRLGRKKIYKIALIIMVVFSILSGISFRTKAKYVIVCLCFFRYWLGIGIGTTYPLSATIMSEYASRKNRGTFIAAVFAMQGVGIIFAGLVPMIVSMIFLNRFPAKPFNQDPIHSTQPQADFIWRIVLGIGAFPAAITYVLISKMPETGRYTALVQGKATQAARGMKQVLDIEIEDDQEMVKQFRAANSYSLFSNEFYKRHGFHLIGTMSTWMLLDIAFYSQKLTQVDLYPAIGLVKSPEKVNAIEEVYNNSRAMVIGAFIGTFPGYWFTVAFIEVLGRFTIQLVGFFMMSVFMLAMGLNYEYLKNHNTGLFAVLYGLTFFFGNFGPNSTTFILPAELFPTRLRSTCHALSAAAGKFGAMIGTFVIQSYINAKVSKIRHALMVMAFTNMIGFCCTFLLAETRRRSLEEITGEDGGQDE